MKITLQHYKQIVSIELEGDEHTVDTVIGRLLIPALIAVGYSQEGIAKLFVDGDPTQWDNIWES